MSALIMGAGPAAMFCADTLLKRGETDITILERGFQMSMRWCPETRVCDCRSCFVIEGEGGAGGFSDGKLPYSLTRGTQMEEIFPPEMEDDLKSIDEIVVEHGGEGVWYEQEGEEREIFPGVMLSSYNLRHVGTDGIRNFAQGFMADLVARGVKVEYGVVIDGVMKSDKGQWALIDQKGGAYVADNTILAPGIQGLSFMEEMARIHEWEVRSGPAGVGIRVETPSEVLQPLFDKFYDWKITAKDVVPGLTLRSFCCNSHGAVTTQYHKDMKIRGVNGHAPLDPALRTESSNFALIAKIDPHFDDASMYLNSDIGGRDGKMTPQDYVRMVARDIIHQSGGHPIVQTLQGFLDDEDSVIWSGVESGFMTNSMARVGEVSTHLPQILANTMSDFLKGVYEYLGSPTHIDAVVYAPELKYPGYRMSVDMQTFRKTGEDNLYIIGDATGYVDSLVAASLTGIAAARAITS